MQSWNSFIFMDSVGASVTAFAQMQKGGSPQRQAFYNLDAIVVDTISGNTAGGQACYARSNSM